jgi:hypothetical protein
MNSSQDKDQDSIAQSWRLRMVDRPEGLLGKSSPKVVHQIAAPVLDGPHHAPGSKTVGPSRVRMEAWRRALVYFLRLSLYRNRCPGWPARLAGGRARTMAASRYRPSGAALAELARARSRRGLRLPAVAASSPPRFAESIGHSRPRNSNVSEAEALRGKRTPGGAGRGPPRRPDLTNWPSHGSSTISFQRLSVPSPRILAYF